MNRAHPLSRTIQVLAFVALGLLVIMIVVSLGTGVAQEPFEVVRPLDAYRELLERQAPVLERVLAADSLFIIAYSAFFVVLGRAARDVGTKELLRLGTLALLGTALLDIVEDQHLFALVRTTSLGETLTLGTLRAQHLLSQTKFHLSYAGLALFALGLPRRDTFERLFALSVGVPLPVLGAFMWIAPPSLEMPLSAARWMGFVFGFLGAIALSRRAVSSSERASRAFESGSGAPA